MNKSFHSSVYKYSSQYTLKSISKQFWTFKRFYFSLVELKVRPKRVFQVVCYFLLRIKSLTILIYQVLVQTQETTMLGQEFILDKQTLSLVSVCRFEIFKQLQLVLIFLEIPFKESIVNNVVINKVIKD